LIFRKAPRPSGPVTAKKVSKVSTPRSGDGQAQNVQRLEDRRDLRAWVEGENE